MRKILLILSFVILNFLFFQTPQSSAGQHVNPKDWFDYNMCHYCPVLQDYPEYGPGVTMTCPSEDAECRNDNNTNIIPSGKLFSEITSPFCFYDPTPVGGTGVSPPNYVTQGEEMGACEGENICTETIGCSDSNPNPDQCQRKDGQICTDQDRCKDGNKCSNYWCVNSQGFLYNEGQSAEGTCRYSDTKPPQGDLGECEKNEDCGTGLVCHKKTKTCAKDDKTFAPNAPLSSPCDNPGDSGCSHIKTVFGFVSTSADDFTRWLLGFVLSISGGIVILIIIISGYRLMTSAGDPEKIKNARDQLTAAIVGLLFIIFSLVILELITRDILGLPGFGSP